MFCSCYLVGSIHPSHGVHEATSSQRIHPSIHTPPTVLQYSLSTRMLLSTGTGLWGRESYSGGYSTVHAHLPTGVAMTTSCYLSLSLFIPFIGAAAFSTARSSFIHTAYQRSPRCPCQWRRRRGGSSSCAGSPSTRQPTIHSRCRSSRCR